MKEIRNHHMPMFRIPKAQYGFNSIPTSQGYQNMFSDQNFGQNTDYATANSLYSEGDRRVPPLPKVPPIPMQPIQIPGGPPTPNLPAPDLQNPETNPQETAQVNPYDSSAWSGEMAAAYTLGTLGEQSNMMERDPSMGMGIFSGGLKGVAQGAQFGPLGAIAGAAVGAGLGAVKAGTAKTMAAERLEQEYTNKLNSSPFRGTDYGRLPGIYQTGATVSQVSPVRKVPPKKKKAGSLGGLSLSNRYAVGGPITPTVDPSDPMDAYKIQAARKLIEKYPDISRGDLDAHRYYTASAKSREDIDRITEGFLDERGRKIYQMKYGDVVQKYQKEGTVEDENSDDFYTKSDTAATTGRLQYDPSGLTPMSEDYGTDWEKLGSYAGITAAILAGTSPYIKKGLKHIGDIGLFDNLFSSGKLSAREKKMLVDRYHGKGPGVPGTKVNVTAGLYPGLENPNSTWNKLKGSKNWLGKGLDFFNDSDPAKWTPKHFDQMGSFLPKKQRSFDYKLKGPEWKNARKYLAEYLNDPNFDLSKATTAEKDMMKDIAKHTPWKLTKDQLDRVLALKLGGSVLPRGSYLSY